MKSVSKIQCLHPQGKHAPSIDAAIFKLFETTIIRILRKESPLTFTELAEAIANNIAKSSISFNKSVEWYGIVVKQHLEAMGVIEVITEKGKKKNRLKSE